MTVVLVTSTLISICAVILLLQKCIHRRLNAFDGPAVAAFTDFWRYLDVKRGYHHRTMQHLHSISPEVVRIGPNVVSIADPQAIPLIYGINRGFKKSSFYDAFQMRIGGKTMPMLFTIKDEPFHASVKRQISGHYNMTSLLEFEPLIDRMIRVLTRKLRTMGHEWRGKKDVYDMDDWVQYFTFDVITAMTFGEPFGFLEKGQDLFGLMRKIEDGMDVEAPVTTMPWIGYFGKKSPWNRFKGQDSSIFPSFVRRHIVARQSDLLRPKRGDAEKPEHPKDFLDRFLSAKIANPKVVTDDVLWCYAITNVVAGSDTVAIPLRTILYHVLRSPDILHKLNMELERSCLSRPVRFNEAKGLPYLDAIVQEALRIHPPVGLGLERIVPPAGLRLSTGTCIPPGTQVQMNAWVVHQNETIFGPGAGEFRPERWLRNAGESEEDFGHRLKRMKQTMFTFGHGSRTCIGKNISLLEIYKVIPSLFLDFQMKLVSKDWWTWNNWFVRQKGLKIQLVPKEKVIDI